MRIRPGCATKSNPIPLLQAWSEKELKAERVAEGTQAFMFETSLGLAVTKWGEDTCQKLDKEYFKCWQKIQKKFTGQK